eukprot:5124061-Pleurochrysis_carterae.AAC.1
MNGVTNKWPTGVKTNGRFQDTSRRPYALTTDSKRKREGKCRGGGQAGQINASAIANRKILVVTKRSRKKPRLCVRRARPHLMLSAKIFVHRPATHEDGRNAGMPCDLQAAR